MHKDGYQGASYASGRVHSDGNGNFLAHVAVHSAAHYRLKWEQQKGRILLDDVDREYQVYALE